MILGNQLLMKNSTRVPKNRNALREIAITNKTPDNLQDSCVEILELNENRFSGLPLQRSLIKSKKINIRANLKQLSDLNRNVEQIYCEDMPGGSE